MSGELNNIELRSEEVNDVLSKVPSWMVRWGNTLFFFLILFLLFLCWIIKYPDIIQTQTIITTQNPPQKEFAVVSGKLDSIYVKEHELVDKNEVLAVLENSAITEDVYFLKSILDTLDMEKRIIKFPVKDIPLLILGDIETAYADFENSYIEYKLNLELNPFMNDAMANQVSVYELKERLRQLKSQYSLSQSELKLKQIDLRRNKNLLNKGVISQSDYEIKQLESFSVEKELKNLNTSISLIRQEIASAKKNTKGTEITRTREELKLLRATFQSYNFLNKAINEWEQKYVLKSEIYGKVSFLKYWSSNQTVSQGDLVFTIIPEKIIDYVAKVKAQPQNSGKIKVGQSVNIKLKNYPETEFGILKGKVSKISQIPDNEGRYYVDVALPKKLITSYDNEIEFKQEMQGTAEIITEDLRLAERVLYEFKSLFDN